MSPDRSRTDSDLTAQRGVSVVRDAVLFELGWLFREQTVSDVGVDAHVEVKDDGEATGRLLALQIKCGQSFFQRETKTGWTFYFSARHHTYWLAHTLPVVVVLVDDVTKQAYWQVVDESTTTKTGRRYKLTVPRAQTVTTAGERWRLLASAVLGRAPARWPGVLDVLSPGTGRVLKSMHEQEPLAAAVIASHLADGRSDPEGTVRTLLSAAPVWIGSSAAWAVLASFAVAHDRYAASAEALLRAVDAADAAVDPSQRRADLRALTALRLLAAEDPVRARNMLDEAIVLDPTSPRVVAVGVVIEHDRTAAHPFDLPPELDDGSERAQRDVVVRSLLADDAGRRAQFDREVALRRELAETAEYDSDSCLALARALLRRANTRQRQHGDEREARALLETALVEVHRWSGPTTDLLQMLLGILLKQEDATAVLRHARTPPHGTATPQEAQRQEVVRAAVEAARQRRDQPLARELARGLDHSGTSRLLGAEVFGQPLPPEQEEQALREALREALGQEQYEKVLSLVMQLALQGADASAEIDDLVARSIIQRGPQQLASALAATRSGAMNQRADQQADGIRRLRALARTDATAAELLVETLDDAGRTDEALAACDQARTRFPHGQFTALRASVLHGAGRLVEAYRTAREALSSDAVTGQAAARLHQLLALEAVERFDWPQAERQFAEAASLQEPPSLPTVWNLVVSVLRQEQPSRAVELLRRYRPRVRDVQDAKVWISAWQNHPLDPEAAAEAVDLAERFLGDAALSAALISCVVLITRPATNSAGESLLTTQANPVADPRYVVPGELHGRAFAAMEAHINLHGAASPFQVMRGTPEELTQQTLDLLREQHEASTPRREDLADLAKRVARGQAPAGLLCRQAGTEYVTGLLERIAGVQVAGALADAEHEQDIADAAAAIDAPVVVDASALVVVSGLPRARDLIEHFPGAVLTLAALIDAQRSAGQALRHLSSPMSWSWDPARQGPVGWHTSAQERARLVSRTEAVSAAAQELPTVEVTDTMVEDLLGPTESDDDRRLTPEEHQEHGPWLSAVALARERQWPLWCDDLGLRRLAREQGLPTFGTPALLEALVREGIEQAQGPHAETQIQQLLQEYGNEVRALAGDAVVDLPVSLADLLALGEADEWQPGAVAVVLSRQLWWTNPELALRDLRPLLEKVVAHRPEALRVWVRAAMVGAAGAFSENPQVAVVLVTAVGMVALKCNVPRAQAEADAQPHRELQAALGEAAAQVLQEQGLPAPGEVSNISDVTAQLVGLIFDDAEPTASGLG